MAATDPQSLLDQAACYQCYSAQAQLLELALLSQIATNISNQISGVTGVYSGNVDPVANPGATGAIYYRTDTGKVWYWNGAAWIALIA